jgi:hypothetical protein
VGEVEPGGALVVEVGERALFEMLGVFIVFGDGARVADGGDGGFIGEFAPPLTRPRKWKGDKSR